MKLNFRKALGKDFLVFLSLVLASISFSVTTPYSGGVDELQHAATAWSTWENLEMPESMMQDSGVLPPSLRANPDCYQFQATTSSKCLNQASPYPNESISYVTVNYSPIYNFIVGAGMHLASIWSQELIPIAGRFTSLLVNLTFLFFAILFLRQSQTIRISQLLIILTPMSLFLFGTINPSGWEISTATLFTSYLVRGMKLYREKEVLTKRTIGWMTVFGVLFVSSRPITLLWFCIILALVFWIQDNRKILLSERLFGLSLSIPVLYAVGYLLRHPYSMPPAPGYVPQETISGSQLVRAFFDSLELFPLHLLQMYGVLGWLDTYPPKFVVAILVSMFLVSLKFSEIRCFLFSKYGAIMGVLLIVLPSAIEAYGWNNWPAWWQGRYLLPLVISMCMILMPKIFGASDLQGFFCFLAILMYSLTGVMIFVNFFRYATGIHGSIPYEMELLEATDLQILSLTLILFAVGLVSVFVYVIFTCNVYQKFQNRVKLYGMLIATLVIFSSIGITQDNSRVQVMRSKILDYGPATSVIGEINSNLLISQSFFSTAKEVSRISLQFATFSRINDNTLRIEIIQNKTGISRMKILDAKELDDNAFKEITFPALLNPDGRMLEYRILVSAENAKTGDAVSLWLTNIKSDEYSFLTINDQRVEENLVFRVYGK